jgi:molecular chaperone HtpG
LIKENQTDKNKTLIYLYTNNKEEQYTYIEIAQNKGYDVLFMDGQLDPHLINSLESKLKDSRFVRVDSDVVEKLIIKEDRKEVSLPVEEQNDLRSVFEGALPENSHYWVSFEDLGEAASPVIITRSEFMRRMKDMAAMNPVAGFYGNMPDSLNLVVNASHPLVKKVIKIKSKSLSVKLDELNSQIKPVEEKSEELKKTTKDKKAEEISQADKDSLDENSKMLDKLNDEKKDLLKGFGKDDKLVKQLIDLALLANNMLKGEELSRFVKRSVDLIK